MTDYGRIFCIMAEKVHGGLTEKLSPFFWAPKTGGKCLWQMINHKTPEQPVTDSAGQGNASRLPKRAGKVSVSRSRKKDGTRGKEPHRFLSITSLKIMKEKKVEERAAAPGVEKA